LNRPFGLSAAGEWVVLLRRADSTAPYVPVDRLRYPALPSNTTFARLSDGFPIWGFSAPGTPCAPNKPKSAAPQELPKIYPNPHQSEFTLHNPYTLPLKVQQFSPSGERLEVWTLPPSSSTTLTDRHAPGLRVWWFEVDGVFLPAVRSIKLP
jgi:hypothetical protein